MPAPDAVVDLPATLLAAGPQGFLEQEQGTTGYQWISNANSSATHVAALDGVPADAIFRGSDPYNRVAYATTDGTGATQIVWYWTSDGTRITLTVPSGYLHPQVSGGAVLAAKPLGDGTYEYHLLRKSGGDTVQDTAVALPAGASAEAAPVIVAADDLKFIVRYQRSGQAAYGVVDAIAGTLQPLPVTGEASGFSMTSSWVTWFSRQGTAGVRVLPSGNLAATPRIVPVTTQSGTSAVSAFTVGDNVLWYEGAHGPLRLYPLSGAETARQVLPDAEQGLQQTDGSLALIGKAADGSRALYDVFLGGDGLVQALPRHGLPPIVYQGSVKAVGLDRGTARFVNSLNGALSVHGKDVGTGLAPVAGADLTAEDVPGTGRFADGTDEGPARLVTDPATGDDALVTADDTDGVPLPSAGGRILDVSPQYVLYEAGDGTGRQYVVDIAQNRVVRAQDAQASALDWSTMWTPSPATAGTVVATSLRTGAIVRTVSLGSGCAPDDLRSNGRLLYWSCAGQHKAGVRDVTTGRDYGAPVGDVLLGDHFVAAYDSVAKAVRVSEVDNDAEWVAKTFTGLKTPPAGDTRGVTWAVDPHSNKIVYVDADDTVHVAKALDDDTVASPLTTPDRLVPAVFAAQGGAARWDARWWLSKPAASWSLSLVDQATGVTARTWTGGEARGSVRVSWDALSGAGKLVANGTYAWKLTAAPADGVGAALASSGTVQVTGAAPAYSGLFARDTSGVLWQYMGTGKAAAPYSGRQKVGSGWQGYTALAALSGQRSDGSGALVARDSSGVLWYYQGTGTPTPPLKARVKVGSGWGGYGVLVGVGDVTGDGRADMVARDGGGVLWLYRGTGSASAPFAARTRIGSGWNTYGVLVGVGDVTGDGRADMVARDGGGVLWLYRGTGSASAPFAARTRIGSGWNTYGALVGAGDVTGDGRADMVARDGGGVLWLYRGTGSASAPFAARTRIGSGWNTYNVIL
ncbi:VCBS repeat-containing protein [Streptomyces sp. HPF1205]|uniref:FG-GAP repeat domain-containing protein n=1 Tax=Streptomyces sp. HPF1205 TaxID=2873262 RepID=UPI001CED483D|nr:VCBS repeat-containing protein [Streptomyces sp. HPF1205]